jgi:hypothetical protein
LFDSFDESSPFHQVYFFQVVSYNSLDEVVEQMTNTGLVLNISTQGSSGVPNGCDITTINDPSIGCYGRPWCLRIKKT